MMLELTLCIGLLNLLVLTVLCLLINELCCLCGLDRWDRKYGVPGWRPVGLGLLVIVASGLEFWLPGVGYIGAPAAVMANRLISVWRHPGHRRDAQRHVQPSKDFTWLAEGKYAEAEPTAERPRLRLPIYIPPPRDIPTRGGTF